MRRIVFTRIHCPVQSNSPTAGSDHSTRALARTSSSKRSVSLRGLRLTTRPYGHKLDLSRGGGDSIVSFTQVLMAEQPSARATVGLGGAAAMAGVSISTMRRWADDGHIPSF